jgi:hypothetical protein
MIFLSKSRNKFFNRYSYKYLLVQTYVILRTGRPFWALSMHLSLVAILGVGQAQGEWVDIGGKVQGELTIYRVYIDPDNIHHNGDVVTLWALFDYQSIQRIVGGPWLSSKAQRQFDCAERRIRLLGYMTFTGNMGSGEPVFSNSQESNWEPITPDSIDNKLWEVACSKK